MIWRLFAYRPQATDHLGRFTQEIMRGDCPLSPGLRELIAAFAGGAGPVILGRAFDVSGSYTATLTVFAIAVAIGASLMLLLPAYPSPLPAD